MIAPIPLRAEGSTLPAAAVTTVVSGASLQKRRCRPVRRPSILTSELLWRGEAAEGLACPLPSFAQVAEDFFQLWRLLQGREEGAVSREHSEDILSHVTLLPRGAEGYMDSVKTDVACT